MADLGDLILRLKVDSSEYERDLKRAKQLAEGLAGVEVGSVIGSNAARNTQQFGNASDKAARNVRGFRDALSTADVALGSFIGNLAADATGRFINAIGEGINALKGFGAESLNVARANQGVENSLNAVFDSSSQVANQLEFVREVADRVGGDATELGRQFANFAAAARTSDPAIGIQDIQGQQPD